MSDPMKRFLIFLLPALALADGPRPIAVTDVTRAGEEIATATLAFGAGRAGWTFDLVAMSGPADGGDDFGAWDRTNVVATIGPNDSTCTWTAPAGFWDDASCLRFALVPKSGMPYDNRIEYVTMSHGRVGYWIDTGVRCTSKNDSYRLETDASFSSTDWFGANYYLQLNASLLSNPSQKSHIVVSYNEEEPYWLHAYQNGNLLGTRGVHGNGAERYWGNQNTPSSVLVAMWALGDNASRANEGNCAGSIWTWKVWKNGVLVSDIVPVVADGKPRVFDRLTGSILKTNHFDTYPDERGPDVPEPPDSTSELLQVVHSDAPVFADAVAVASVLGDAATLSGSLVSFGGDAEDCELSVLVGTRADLSDAVVATNGAPASSGAFSLVVSGLSPETSYYAAVVAAGGAGGTNRSDAVAFTTLGAWTIASASVSTDQRLATFTIDAVQGAGDATFQLLVSAAQLEKESPVVRSSGGTFTIEWNSDGDPDIVWDETYEWRIRVSSEFAGVGWTNVYSYSEIAGTMSFFVFRDKGDYTWTGLGGTPAWSDTNNWALPPGTPGGKGYPDHAKNWNGESWCSATFTNGTVADVLLDGNRTAGPLRVQGSGTQVTVRGAPGTSLRIGTFDFGSQTDGELGCVFRLDGARAVFENDVRIGNGNALVLDNGANVTMNSGGNMHALWIAAYNRTFADYCGRVEVRGGATLDVSTVEGLSLGGNGTLLVSNATVRATTYVYFNAYTLGGRIRLEGDSPVLEVPGVLRGWNNSGFTGEQYGVLEFAVPKRGWTNAPVRCVEDERNHYAVPLGGTADTSVAYGGQNSRPMRLRVAEDSPAFRSGQTDTALVSWAPGVNPARVRLDETPKPAKDLWLSASSADAPWAWTEVSEWTASTPMPLAMGARLVGTGGTLVLLK